MSGFSRGVDRVIRRMDDMLPNLSTGAHVPRHGWRQRHAWILAGLWAHVPFLFFFGVWGGVDHVFTGGTYEAFALDHVVLELAPVALMALAASLPGVTRRMRSLAVAGGYAWGSALLVHYSGGLIEAHFHVLLVLAIVSLYQDWLPLLISVVVVSAHHVIVGFIDPAAVYNHPVAQAHPLRWSLVHAFFILAVASVEVVHWRSMQQVRDFGDHVVEASEEGLVGMDETGHVTFVNKAASRLLGAPERLQGVHGSRVFANRLPGMVGAHGILRTLDDHALHKGRGILVVTPMGETRYVDWSSVPLKEGDVFAGLVVSLRDVTERHMAERRLRQKEAQLSAAQRIAHLGSFEWAPVSDVLQASDEFYRILSDPDAPTPRMERLVDLLARVHHEDQGRVREALEQAHMHGGDVDVECRVLAATGIRHCEIRARLEHGTDGEGPVRLIRGSIHDVTERVQAEAARRRERDKDREIVLLREQDEFKNRFINAVAHELNTPLTPLRLQLHLLRMDPERRLSERQQNSVLMLERNVRRFGALVEDLLDTARLQGGRIKMRPVPVDLGGVVDESVRHFEPIADERNLQVTLDLEAGVIVHGDRDRLTQVVMNLVSNACKFTRPEGEVELALRRHKDEAILKVRDTGIGISAEDQARLFRPFQQLADPMRSTDTGTGLGLFLSKGLVEAMGGSIECESAGIGEGTTFTVRLPAAPMHRQGTDSAVVAALGAQEHVVAVPPVPELRGGRAPRAAVDDRDEKQRSSTIFGRGKGD